MFAQEPEHWLLVSTICDDAKKKVISTDGSRKKAM